LTYTERVNEVRPWFEKVVIPALLRHARNTYGAAMRRALDQAGYGDLPKNGLYIIGGMNLNDKTIPLSQLIKELGVSKQAAGQLVDALIQRKYLARTRDAVDRRKVTIRLSKRGRAAAMIQSAAREKVDAELAARVGVGKVRQLRRALGVLIEMQREQNSSSRACYGITP
jgi:DNA-binding MarR family transcriptional regulator